MIIKRNRIVYFSLIIVVILSGLASRKFNSNLPSFIAEYSGDTLWALMIFFITGFIFITYSTRRIAVISLACCFLIEVSKLYPAEWINNLRNTKLGGLVLGYGFLWSDLICYTAGIMLGIVIEKVLLKNLNSA
ncbi:MAG: DUF2809 domain-containing protein [Ignavibacteria bacterium]|nr:DUF2809 domain-containing protein [Ignavibacteria bacterium]